MKASWSEVVSPGKFLGRSRQKFGGNWRKTRDPPEIGRDTTLGQGLSNGIGSMLLG